MKPTEITKKVEELISLLSSNSQNGVFGPIKVLRTNRVKMVSKISVANNNLLWEPDDFKPLFQVKHLIHNELFKDPLYFSIGRKEIWISTWYLGAGEEDALNHPFVLSWNKFLEKNKIKQTVGLDGSCNADFFDLEKGFQILKLWIEWVLKYS